MRGRASRKGGDLRRLLRWALDLATAVSALLFVATCVLWVADRRHEGTFGRVGRHGSVYALAAGGTVTLYAGATAPGESSRWLGGTWPVPNGPSLDDFPWRSLGFRYAVGGTSGGNVMRAWTVPDWFPALLFLAAPLLMALRRWRSRRMARGLALGRCPSCGCDLRATPGRCPECGHVPTTPASR